MNSAWPDGSIVVKDGYSGGTQKLTAIMEKVNGAWFFAEYDKSGAPIFSGAPKVCIDCHQPRAHYSDWLYSMEFPR